MDFNYPQFLDPNAPHERPKDGSGGNMHQKTNDFSDSLFSKLTRLERTNDMAPSPTSEGFNDLGMDNFSNFQHSPQFGLQKNAFNLPSELQGGIGTISSRRPSYAAESFTRASSLVNPPNSTSQLPPQSSPQTQIQQARLPSNSNNLASYAMFNSFNQAQQPNYNLEAFNDSFASFNLNANFNDFQARRPSQLVDYNQPQMFNSLLGPDVKHLPQMNPPLTPVSQSGHQAQHKTMPNAQSKLDAGLQAAGRIPQQQNQISLSEPQVASKSNPGVKLENGLLLRDQYMVASSELKELYKKTTSYFHSSELSTDVLGRLKSLLVEPTIMHLVEFTKNLNNLAFNNKELCLVVNKNGKCDLLSYPTNSNMFLQENDLVIVDGDRGRDLVMILEPLVDLNLAILFNFLKKSEHLKSLSIQDENFSKTGIHSTSINASDIVNNTNEDNEFIINLPTKQVLRFAVPKEVHKISGKLLEEKKAFTTCYNKIKELNLQNDLRLINVEYQFDLKKLIFYYFAGFKRIDFRALIRELYKIYKTRIWLCAVLPYEKDSSLWPGSDHKYNSKKTKPEGQRKDSIPAEYQMSNEQILRLTVNELDNLSTPNYFHLLNFSQLIEDLDKDIRGNFYGFNAETGITNKSSGPQDFSNNIDTKNDRGVHDRNPMIIPQFNPFGS